MSPGAASSRGRAGRPSSSAEWPVASGSRGVPSVRPAGERAPALVARRRPGDLRSPGRAPRARYVKVCRASSIHAASLFIAVVCSSSGARPSECAAERSARPSQVSLMLLWSSLRLGSSPRRCRCPHHFPRPCQKLVPLEPADGPPIRRLKLNRSRCLAPPSGRRATEPG